MTGSLTPRSDVDTLTVTKINNEIERLKKERERILNAEKAHTEESIRSLEWTKDCHARLLYSSMASAGIPTYTVLVYGPQVPHSLKHITVMGDSVHYDQNITFHNGFSDSAEFTTSNHELLIEFLQKVKFQKLEYNVELLKVLKVAEAMSFGVTWDEYRHNY